MCRQGSFITCLCCCCTAFLIWKMRSYFLKRIHIAHVNHIQRFPQTNISEGMDLVKLAKRIQHNTSHIRHPKRMTNNYKKRLSFASAKVNFTLSNGANIISNASTWQSHFYIFVGGDHNTGTSLLERLLSTQTNSSGLRVNGQSTNRIESCSRPVKTKYRKKHCKARIFTYLISTTFLFIHLFIHISIGARKRRHFRDTSF